jgi:hypothetical protein
VLYKMRLIIIAEAEIKTHRVKELYCCINLIAY